MPLLKAKVQKTRGRKPVEIGLFYKEVTNNQETFRRQALFVLFQDQSVLRTKNVIKFYTKALCSFVSSSLAVPYLEQINLKHGINIKIFQNYIYSQRALLVNLNRIRALFIINQNDGEALTKFKKVFQEIS